MSTLTAEEAAKQLTDRIEASGKFNIGNVLDSLIGVVAVNSSDLQALLDDLLKKKGVLSSEDQEMIEGLLQKQEQEKKKRQGIRIKNTVFIALAITFTVTAIYFTVRKKHKS